MQIVTELFNIGTDPTAPSAIADFVTYIRPMREGNYTVYLIYRGGQDRGIFHVYIDGVEKGTIDGYHASNNDYQYNIPGWGGSSEAVTFTINGISLVEIKIAMKSKNAASSGYFGYLHCIMIVRTSDLP